MSSSLPAPGALPARRFVHLIVTDLPMLEQLGFRSFLVEVVGAEGVDWIRVSKDMVLIRSESTPRAVVDRIYRDYVHDDPTCPVTAIDVSASGYWGHGSPAVWSWFAAARRDVQERAADIAAAVERANAAEIDDIERFANEQD